MTGRLVVIGGPTGTGKSELALELASRLDGQIVNADAMQLYRGMDIGTAKVPADKRRDIPHHLLDVLDIDQAASVAVYQQRARAVIEGILSSGRTPILTGGSGLYISAVVDQMSFPGTDPQLRAQLIAECEQLEAGLAHARLARLDPAAAKSIHPGNIRRIARALEVIELTGKPFTATLPVRGPARYRAVMITLDRDTAELDRSLADRVSQMVQAGFVDEVAALAQRGLRQTPTAGRALGYPQMMDHLDGLIDLDQAMADTVTATRRFVRRQRSWFRRDHRAIWLDAGDPNVTNIALQAIETVDLIR